MMNTAIPVGYISGYSDNTGLVGLNRTLYVLVRRSRSYSVHYNCTDLHHAGEMSVASRVSLCFILGESGLLC